MITWAGISRSLEQPWNGASTCQKANKSFWNIEFSLVQNITNWGKTKNQLKPLWNVLKSVSLVMFFSPEFFWITLSSYIIFTDEDITNEITPDYSGFSITAWVMGAVLPTAVTDEWSRSPYGDIPIPVLYRFDVNCIVRMLVKHRISALTNQTQFFDNEIVLSTCFRFFPMYSEAFLRSHFSYKLF